MQKSNHEISTKSKNTNLISRRKPINSLSKTYRLLSMNDSILNKVVNNSMEEKKDSKKIDLNNSKMSNQINSFNNSLNYDNNKKNNSSISSENRKKYNKYIYPYSSRNSTGKKTNLINLVSNEIPIPKNKIIQNKINTLNNNLNDSNTNKDNKDKNIMKSKIKSSTLLNTNDIKRVKENINYKILNKNNDYSCINKEKKNQNQNNMSNSNNTNDISNNNYVIKNSNSNSKEEIREINKKTRILNNNNLDYKGLNSTHNNIPLNITTTITNLHLKTNPLTLENSNFNNNYISLIDKNNTMINLNNNDLKYNLNMKIVDELTSTKLKNTKLENDILLLDEKVKSLNQIQTFYSNENDILKSKLTDLQDDYKKDLENVKKYKSELNQIKMLNIKFSQNLKSTVMNLLDIIELLLSPRGNNPKQSLLYNENNSYSIDIYDSYNNEEERRNIIFDQIQNLLISKFNIMKKILSINLDSEIEKVRNWSNAFNINKFNNNEINVSNIKLSVKNNESSCSYESSKKNSQDFFDLSISNQFLLKNSSPKFNNSFGIENDTTSEKHIMTNKGKKHSNSNIINTNAFNTNNFLSAGNLSLNNMNIMSTNSKNCRNDSICSANENKQKDINSSINNINNLSLCNLNLNNNFNLENNINNLNNNNNKITKETNNNVDEKMIHINLNFNDSFLKDLTSGHCIFNFFN